MLTLIVHAHPNADYILFNEVQKIQKSNSNNTNSLHTIQPKVKLKTTVYSAVESFSAWYGVYGFARKI